jgi:hypothetical protein
MTNRQQSHRCEVKLKRSAPRLLHGVADMTHPRFINLRDCCNMRPARPGLIRAWIADVIAVACLAAIFLAVPWILYAIGGWL